MTAPRQNCGKAGSKDTPIAEPLASASNVGSSRRLAPNGGEAAGVEDLVAALRSRVKDDAGLYQACGLKAPEAPNLADFEPWEIAEEAIHHWGCLPPLDQWSRETALKYLPDLVRIVIPDMSPIERHDFLQGVGFTEELERIEAALVAGRSGEALDRLQRLIRPVWMAGPPKEENAGCGHGA